MKGNLRISLLVVFLASLQFVLTNCKDDSGDDSGDAIRVGADEKPNVLLIIADDMGKDATNGFSEGSIKPITPNIDKIKDDGVSFSNYWVYPTCTPTRSSMITGKFGYRTGVKNVGDILSTNETVLQAYINQNNSYATAIVGKWHLAGSNIVNPEDFGIDYYAGIISGAVNNYYRWDKTEDGGQTRVTEYTTTHLTSLSMDWIEEQSKPWFLWLAYNAPHTPFHVPPSEMHSQGNLADYVDGEDPMPYYMAAIEALDFQIGRLLASLSEEQLNNTVIIFMGDNGTPNQVAQTPYTSNTVKGSLFQGGINVPLFVSGKDVTRTGTDTQLITSTDMFATIANITGNSISEIHDSKSFYPLLTNEGAHRDYQYSEYANSTQEEYAISDGQYKLVVRDSSIDRLFYLKNDPYEKDNLLMGGQSSEELQIKARLEAAAAEIRK